MLLSLDLVTAPTVEPVTVAQLKQHLRIAGSFTDDDTLLATLISAARRHAEAYTRRAFFSQQWRMSLDHFPQTYEISTTVNPSQRRDWFYYAGMWTNSTIALPKPKLQSVDSITYVDASGATQTLNSSAYTVDASSEPARIVPGAGLFWPVVTAYIPGSVKITFTTGAYVEQTDCPEDIQVANLLLASQWYSHPEALAVGGNFTEMPFAVTALLSPYRVDVLDLQRVV